MEETFVRELERQRNAGTSENNLLKGPGVGRGDDVSKEGGKGQSGRLRRVASWKRLEHRA